MTTFLGYVRVSTEKQNCDMQMAALSPICGDRIWQEKKSGMTQAGRTELQAVVAEAKRLRGNGEAVTLVCYSLSRLGRRLVETVTLIEELNSLGIGFKSVSESLDTTTPMGRAFVNIICSLAQAEAELLSERTKAGLAARRAAGVKLGRPSRDHSTELAQAKQLVAGGLSVREAARRTGMNNSTLLRMLKSA
jgi:DNA invertase Pin-like site-specific DNA recombinase